MFYFFCFLSPEQFRLREQLLGQAECFLQILVCYGKHRQQESGSFIGSWGDYISSMMYLNTPKMYTAAYALKMFSDNTGTDYGATFAMSTLSLMPIMVLFFFFQKQLIEGCSFDGLKG